MFVNQKIITLLGLFTASVFSCSPSKFGGNYIGVILTGVGGLRMNVGGGALVANSPIIAYNDSSQPAENEIFTIVELKPGVFEFISYLSYYRNYAIGIPSANSGDTFRLQQRTDSGVQQFTFDCGTCNIKTNAQDWTPYHTSCNIKNVGTGFCMVGDPATNGNPVKQTDCATASKWDFWGRISFDIANSTNSSKPSTTQIYISPFASSTPGPSPSSTDTSDTDIHLSSGKLVGIVLGSCAGTMFIALFAGYWFFHRQRFTTKANADYVNVQVYK